MSQKKVTSKIDKLTNINLLVLLIGVNVVSNHLLGNSVVPSIGLANAQAISQTKNKFTPNVANVNEVKSFVYSWFALLDRQVSEISLLKFLAQDNLTMKFPSMMVNNHEDFSQWYLNLQKDIKTNSYDIQQLLVIPTGAGEFEVKLKVNWQAKTLEGANITQSYTQQWKIVSDDRNRLLIQDYLVEKAN